MKWRRCSSLDECFCCLPWRWFWQRVRNVSSAAMTNMKNVPTKCRCRCLIWTPPPSVLMSVPASSSTALSLNCPVRISSFLSYRVSEKKQPLLFSCIHLRNINRFSWKFPRIAEGMLNHATAKDQYFSISAQFCFDF